MKRSSDGISRSASSPLPLDSSDITLDDSDAGENHFFRSELKSLSHDAFANEIRSDLGPRSALQEVLTDRIIAASWTLREVQPWQLSRSRGARFAERSLYRSILALSRIQERSQPSFSRDELPEPEQWRAHLVMDPDLSENSPVIRGTWITVDQVICRIVEGSTWDDLLRDHPELTTDDIRACLAYTIEDEESR